MNQLEENTAVPEDNNEAIIEESDPTDKHDANATTVESTNQVEEGEEQDQDQEEENDTDAGPAKKIFVGGIPKVLSENEFETHFKSFGSVNDIILMRYPGNSQNRGFGFVQYNSIKIADHVLSVTHKLGPNDHEVTVNYSKSRENIKEKRFFVGGIPKNLSESAYKNYFSTFGEVEDTLFRPEKGYGFVEFKAETDEDIKNIKDIIHQKHKIDGQDIRVAIAKPKGERSDRDRSFNGPRAGRNDWGHNGGRGYNGGYNQGSYGNPYGGYQGGYNAGYGVPPQSGGYGGYSYNAAPPAPSAVQGYAPPSGYGAPPQSSHAAASGGYGSAPPSASGAYGASGGYNSSGYGAPPSSSGYGQQQSQQSSYRPY